jgi:hypothetical protein
MTTTTNTTKDTIISRVRNYQGSNSFVMKMKDSLNKWGNLTPKQLEAAEKCLNAPVVEVKLDELPENLQKIAKYEGENSFVKDIAQKLKTYGTLTAKQIEAANKQIEKEESKAKTYKMNWPTVGETIKVGRRVGQQLKEKYGLNFNPILLDITKVTAVSPKAVQFVGKMTIKRGDVCMCCAKTLTDEFSMLTRMGKICAGHMKVPYITDASQAEKFREDYLKRVDEIGEMEFWVPKSQIKKWDGGHVQKIVHSLHR